jgi:REP element-mobilizing transposase RayT
MTKPHAVMGSGCAGAQLGRQDKDSGPHSKGDRANRKTGGQALQGGRHCSRSQLAFEFPNTWGGSRRGAGRKAGPGRSRVPHAVRPQHRGYQPVHVTLRSHLRSLRAQQVFPTVRGAIADANRRAQARAQAPLASQARSRARFRIVHFSVQANHLHLLVEAEDRSALLAGMRGVAVSLARRLNRLIFRGGAIWADRWHGRALSSPRAVRHALVYLFGNFRKHGERLSTRFDPCSSAPYFADFLEYQGRTPLDLATDSVARALRRDAPTAIGRARTWLLRVGWLRHGRISVDARPG